MYNDKILSMQNLENFNYEETKRQVKNYFKKIEKLEWQLAKINIQKGLTTKYDLTHEYQKYPYSPMSEDNFNLSVKENVEEQYIRYMSNYYWAKSLLSDKEQIYIEECFVSRKCEEDLINILGFKYIDGYDFKKLKRSAIYKFADFLDLVVEESGGEEYRRPYLIDNSNMQNEEELTTIRVR